MDFDSVPMGPLPLRRRVSQPDPSSPAPDPGTVSVVIVPRERFSAAPESLARILSVTPAPTRIVYVEGNAPRRIRVALHAVADERVEFVASDTFLTPNEARNKGFAHVRTEYTVFLDNDVWVGDDWLPPLLCCARDTGAAIVGPLYLQGPRSEPEVHMAGGLAHIEERDGRRFLRHNHRFQGVPLVEVASRIVRTETEQVEFHGMLVESELLRDLGGLDEGLMCTREHIDLCMSVRARGRSVFLEPASRLTYTRPPPFALYDLRYFSLRWSEDWSQRTLDHFFAKWDLDRSQIPYLITWTKKQRYRFLEPWYSNTTRWLARRFGEERMVRLLHRTLYPLEGLANRLATRLLGGREGARSADRRPGP